MSDIERAFEELFVASYAPETLRALGLLAAASGFIESGLHIQLHRALHTPSLTNDMVLIGTFGSPVSATLDRLRFAVKSLLISDEKKQEMLTEIAALSAAFAERNTILHGANAQDGEQITSVSLKARGGVVKGPTVTNASNIVDVARRLYVHTTRLDGLLTDAGVPSVGASLPRGG